MADPHSPTLHSARFFLDATPLLDTSWTGISVVCASIARQLMGRALSLSFFLDQTAVPAEAVQDALARSSGLSLARDLDRGRLPTGALMLPRDKVSVGLSASVKRSSRVFDVECSWIHDLSTLLQPEYHTPENIVWHTERMLEDIASNDLTICISQATRDDLVSYLDADPARLVVAPNGVEWPWWYHIRQKNERSDPADQYLLVLGTREPRKNLRLVFEMLEEFPSLLANYRVVIVGGEGWLSAHTAIPDGLAAAVASGRISATGFVSDFEKYRLLRGAEMTIFPSLFEGFGLPVIESLSVGTPCVASFSSSLPEVGGDLCHYFDPFSAVSLHDTLQSTLVLGLKRDAEFAAAAAEWASTFSWKKCVDVVLAALLPLIERAQVDRADADRALDFGLIFVMGNATARPQARRLVGRSLCSTGYIDVVTSSGYIDGWAWDTDHPALPLIVSLRNDAGYEVAWGSAYRYRNDLAAANCAYGWCAFHLRLALEIPAVLNVRLTLLDRASAAEIYQAEGVPFVEERDASLFSLEDLNDCDPTALKTIDQLRGCEELFLAFYPPQWGRRVRSRRICLHSCASRRRHGTGALWTSAAAEFDNAVQLAAAPVRK